MFGNNEIIQVLAESNPKKAGSKAHGRFALYETGMTVKKFLEIGGQISDLKWDSERKYIQIGVGATNEVTGEPEVKVAYTFAQVMWLCNNYQSDAYSVLEELHGDIEEAKGNLEEHFSGSEQIDRMEEQIDALDRLMSDMDNFDFDEQEVEEPEQKPTLALPETPLVTRGSRRGMPKRLSTREYRELELSKAETYVEKMKELLEDYRDTHLDFTAHLGDEAETPTPEAEQFETIEAMLRDVENLDCSTVEL